MLQSTRPQYTQWPTGPYSATGSQSSAWTPDPRNRLVPGSRPVTREVISDSLKVCAPQTQLWITGHTASGALVAHVMSPGGSRTVNSPSRSGGLPCCLEWLDGHCHKGRACFMDHPLERKGERRTLGNGKTLFPRSESVCWTTPLGHRNPKLLQELPGGTYSAALPPTPLCGAARCDAVKLRQIEGTDKWGTQHRIIPGKVPLPRQSESPGYKQLSTYGPQRYQSAH